MFFKYFPVIVYRDNAVPNITARPYIPEEILQQGYLYYPYTIEDGDRPDTIAGLYYDDPLKDWLIKIANNIYDLDSQWPLTQNMLDAYIKSKYNSLSVAYSTIKHYASKTNIPDITEQDYSLLNNDQRMYWSQTNKGDYTFIRRDIVLNPASYDALNPNVKQYWSAVSVYDYEFDLNEKKRNIKLIDKRYADTFESLLKETLRG